MCTATNNHSWPTSLDDPHIVVIRGKVRNYSPDEAIRRSPVRGRSPLSLMRNSGAAALQVFWFFAIPSNMTAPISGLLLR